MKKIRIPKAIDEVHAFENMPCYLWLQPKRS